MIILSNETLYNHYTMNFALRQYHGYSLTELDEMVPFERDIYMALLENHLEEEKQRIKKQNEITWT